MLYTDQDSPGRRVLQGTIAVTSHDDDFDEDDYAGFDTSDADDDATEPCPYCGEAVYDDAERCPACGSYLSREDAPLGKRPWWLIAGIVLCILIVLTWILGGVF